MTTTPDFLNEFDEDIVAPQQISFCQILNPDNLPLSKIQQFKLPWGIFIPQEQAELVELNAPDHFTPTHLVFDPDSAEPREEDGFLTQHIRFSLIHRSKGIEVQEKTNNGWKYVGQAYYNNKPSKYKEFADTDRDHYRLRTRYLILFLDENNAPLHRIPLRLSLGSGTGASIGEEVKVFRDEIERVFFKLRQKPRRALSDAAHALTVLDIKLGIHKSDGKSPFVCPAERLAPAIDQVGHEKIVKRRERQVKLIGTPIQSLIIPKSSETGQLILSLWEDYKDFPTRFQDEVVEDHGVETKPDDEGVAEDGYDF